MLGAVEEVKLTGEIMGDAAREFANDPCSSVKRGNMVGYCSCSCYYFCSSHSSWPSSSWLVILLLLLLLQVRASRNLLSAVTRLLILADMIDVHLLLKKLRRVEDDLEYLKSVSSQVGGTILKRSRIPICCPGRVDGRYEQVW